MIKPIRLHKLSDQIFEQLRDMIYRGELQPGERLIPERELALHFGAGRPSLREALRKLADQGLIVSKRGAGSFVTDEKTQTSCSPLFQVLDREQFTVAELHEVRLVLEANSAELAAKRATDDDVRTIIESERRIRRERSDRKIRMRTDLSFHMNIAFASKNIVQIHIMKILYDVLLYAMEKAYNIIIESQSLDNDLIDSQHKDIVKAIANHDPMAARQAMESQILLMLEICRKHGL